MAKEGQIFKTTAGNEVYRSNEVTLQAVRQWLVQNGIPDVTETMCKEHMHEFVKRFKIVELPKEEENE